MKIGWFSSGRGSGSQALLSAAVAAIESGKLPVEIAYLFCNRDRGEHAPADQLLDLASAHGIPVVTLSSNAYRRAAGGAVVRAGDALPAWRSDYDRAILSLIEPFGAQVSVLAGYQLIAPELCRNLDLINLHPAAPGGPVGLWQEVIWRLIAQRARESGVTIFRAIPELDAGPLISFCLYSLRDAQIDPLWDAVNGRDLADIRAQSGEELPLFQEIRRRGATREAPLLLATLAALAEGRLHLQGGDVVDAARRPAPALDLSTTVDVARDPTV
jgi:phosphoribosylglycinamide formyltransferase-1